MVNTYINTFTKSILAFGIASLAPWLKTASMNPLSTLSQHSTASLMLNANELPEMLDTDSFKVSVERSLEERLTMIGIEAGSAFLCFMMLMIIMDILIFASSFLKKRSSRDFKEQIPGLDVPQTEETAPMTGISNQKGFVVNILKIVFSYCLCYLFYTMIFAGISFACNVYINAKQPFLQSEQSLFGLEGRTFEELFQGTSEGNYSIGSTKTRRKNQRLLESLNSVVGQSLFQTELDVSSIALSENGTIAFLGVCESVLELYSLQILNITTKNMPQFLGTISFPITSVVFSDFQGSNCENTEVFSSNGQTIFMSTGSVLQIVDASNLTSPTSISSYSFGSDEYIMSISLTSDGNYALLNTYIFGLENGGLIENYTIRVLNITNINSPQPMTNLIDPSSTPIDSLSIYNESAYVRMDQNLLIFDLSAIQNPTLTSSLLLPVEGIMSFIWSSDYQTAFAISGNLVLQVLNLANISNITISQGCSIPYSSNMVLSTDNIHLFITDSTFLQIFDVSDPNNITAFPPTGINSDASFAICSDGQTVLSSDGEYFYIIQLNLNIEATQAFQIQNNVFETIAQPDNISTFFVQITLSPDGNTLYAFTEDSYINYLLIADVSSGSFSSWNSVQQLDVTLSDNIAISSDGKYLFGASNSIDNYFGITFRIFNISSMQNISNMVIPQIPNYFDFNFAISPIGNIALVTQNNNFLLLNISDCSNISILSNTSIQEDIPNSIHFMNDDQTLILVGPISADLQTYIKIYDISVPSNPELLTTFTDEGYPVSATFSPDESLAFILAQDTLTRLCVLNIINISSLATPTIVTSMDILAQCQTDGSVGPFIVPVPPSTQALLVATIEGIISINISVPTAPQLLDYYNISSLGMAFNPDKGILYIASANEINMTTFKPNNLLNMNPTTVPLGTQYTNTLNVLAKNSENLYDADISDFKFISVYLYNPSFTDLYLGEYQEFFISLPSWADFDKDSGLMTLQPNSQSQIGSYNIYGAFSTQIPNNVFNNISSVNGTNGSLAMLTNLMFYGYVDNQFYLTSNFDPTQPLMLPLEYQPYEQQYRDALAAYFFEAWTTINIVSSLTLTLIEPSTPSPTALILINTNSFEPMTTVITLEPQDSQPMFVTTGSLSGASFSQNNSVVNMIGSLTDVNSTLSQIIIFLNGSDSCNGNITITDGLNPTLNQFVPNISQYFMISSQPSINNSYLSSQLSKVQPQTGEQFVIQFDSSTFMDSTNQPLTLTVQMQDGSQAPEWLELKGYTLIGTPPEQLTGRDLNLALIVSNQYQATETNFALNVGISIGYAFKMIGSVLGVLITVLGLWVYAVDIYNIFGKKHYRYSKDFMIRSGQEIVPKVLYPILFAAEHLQESRLIIKHIDRKIAQELKDNSQAKIAFYFTVPNSYKIDTVKLWQAIQDSAVEIQDKDQAQLRLYTSEMDSDKDIINQLIINTFIVRLLDLETEKSTKVAFDQIKGELFSLVDIDKCPHNGLCTFSVNKPKLFARLGRNNKTNAASVDNSEDRINLSASSSRSGNNAVELEQKSSQEKSLETELIPDTPATTLPQRKVGVNIELLVSVMEAYACNNHIIDDAIINVDVVGRRRLDKIWAFEGIIRFLKRDLQIIGFSGKALSSYGLEYKAQKSLLVFEGTANENIKDTTLVVQVVSRRGRILREIWMYGVDDQPENRSLVEGIL